MAPPSMSRRVSTQFNRDQLRMQLENDNRKNSIAQALAYQLQDIERQEFQDEHSPTHRTHLQPGLKRQGISTESRDTIMYGKSLFGAGNNNEAQGHGLSSYQFGQAE